MCPTQRCSMSSNIDRLQTYWVDTSIGVIDYCNDVCMRSRSVFCCYSIGNRAGKIPNITTSRNNCSCIRNCYVWGDCSNNGIPFCNCIYSISVRFRIANDCCFCSCLLSCKREGRYECIMAYRSLSYSNCPFLRIASFCSNNISISTGIPFSSYYRVADLCRLRNIDCRSNVVDVGSVCNCYCNCTMSIVNTSNSCICNLCWNSVSKNICVGRKFANYEIVNTATILRTVIPSKY